MNYSQWKDEIINSCTQAGTYQPYYGNIINTLAEILERKDAATMQFKAAGERYTIEYTNKAGATNIITNPLIKTINELDKQALLYWRELGLTPLRNKRAATEPQPGKLADFIKQFDTTDD